MSTERSIPIVIGVTAHRAIREEDRPAIRAAVRDQLEKLQTQFPHSPLTMLCSLAEGGDLLCADVAEELDMPLIAALPRPREEYEEDFSPEAKERLAYHCGRAEQVFVAPPMEEMPPDGNIRDYQFRQAGIYVAAHSHILLALWDGGAGTSAACGTAEAVDFALNGNYCPTLGLSPRSGSNEAVIHVFTPRGDRRSEAAGTVHILGNRQAVWECLARTEEYNRLSETLPESERSLLPEVRAEDPVLDRMERVYLAASTLSSEAARLYRRVLALLAFSGALLTFAFLMYDEAQALWMILVCGAVLIVAWASQRYAARSDCHRRYLEYRVLAECLRVQSFLRYAGSSLEAAELFSWTQREETAWVLDALCALNCGNPPEESHEIRSCWAEDQREYHGRATKKAARKLAFSERAVRTALMLSVVLYLAAVGFELLCGGLIFSPRVVVSDVESWRTVLKILVGTISAVTLFVANYYGRFSLPRTLSDHQKMERFYADMSARLEHHGQTEELLTVLAREELIENGNWCSYQRDNKPDFSI